MVAFAAGQLGRPYRFGASGPAAFDCSGLTMAAYGQVGLALPHSAREQGRMGWAVPFSAARPGDLVVWPGHVGVYVGGGMVIHAPRPGDVVRRAALWGRPGFRRLI